VSSGIVITGLGPAITLGFGKEAVWAGLQDAPPSLSTVQQMVSGEEWESYQLAAVRDVDLEKGGILKQELAAMTLPAYNRDLHLFASAARIAVQDSGLKFERERNRVGLVISHENPGFDTYTSQIWTALENQPENRSNLLEQIKAVYSQVERAGYNTHSFVMLQQLTVLLQAHGPALSVNNACSSGMYALETAAQWLRAGHADAMVVVCGDSPRLIARYLWLKTAKTCAADSVIRPFDKYRNGFVLGEGAGAVVIETEESARKRGAHVYTRYLVGSFRSDAWKLSLPAVTPHLYEEALHEAIQNSGKKLSSVDLVVPHGAATAIQDRYEADGITRVFGKNQKRPFVTALKPYVGHTLAGCSLIELILTLIGISHDTVLPTLNWTTADDKLGLIPVQKHTSYKVNTWIKTATGFGGFNAACVFEQPGVPT
jgi:3-oxoacyl-[acyl-carrier-protein] synthase II